MAKKEPGNNVRIRGISDQRYATIKNIAAYFGIAVGTFLKSEILKIIEAYPDHIKNFKAQR